MSRKGICQAQYWEKAFRTVAVKKIYASPLQRCRETARLIAGGRKILTTDELKEINLGLWENQPFDTIKTKDPKAFESRGNNMDTFRPPKGESFKDLSDRVMPFFRRQAADGQNTLIVTHAGVIRVILCRILNIGLKNLFRIRLDYGELFILQGRTVP